MPNFANVNTKLNFSILYCTHKWREYVEKFSNLWSSSKHVQKYCVHTELRLRIVVDNVDTIVLYAKVPSSNTSIAIRKTKSLAGTQSKFVLASEKIRRSRSRSKLRSWIWNGNYKEINNTSKSNFVSIQIVRNQIK